MCLAAIAKGPDRNAGAERFFIPGREPFQLPPGDPVVAKVLLPRTSNYTIQELHKLNTRANALQGFTLLPTDIAPLVAFLKSLNEDYQ